jgi:hypothetical protein
VMLPCLVCVRVQRPNDAQGGHHLPLLHWVAFMQQAEQDGQQLGELHVWRHHTPCALHHLQAYTLTCYPPCMPSYHTLCIPSSAGIHTHMLPSMHAVISHPVLSIICRHTHSHATLHTCRHHTPCALHIYVPTHMLPTRMACKHNCTCRMT